jgi:hypothetical protein
LLQRKTVAANNVVSPTSGRNGLGFVLRERGQSLVPLPPHRMTGTIVVTPQNLSSQQQNHHACDGDRPVAYRTGQWVSCRKCVSFWAMPVPFSPPPDTAARHPLDNT